MTGERKSGLEPGVVAPSRIPVPALVPAIAAVGAGTLWFALSVWTGLIYHFMPAAPMLVAVWVRRALRRDAPSPWRLLRMDLAVGVAVAVGTSLAITAAGGSLDDAWLVALVIAVGIGLATWLGRRRTA
ncbi:MAG: hypothetical protein H0T59_05420 [Chloroflexi bacterium]|nr:hypothetical protein [Chloroflexota bacterium]